jgi:hypothetical protein
MLLNPIPSQPGTPKDNVMMHHISGRKILMLAKSVVESSTSDMNGDRTIVTLETIRGTVQIRIAIAMNKSTVATKTIADTTHSMHSKNVIFIDVSKTTVVNHMPNLRNILTIVQVIDHMPTQVTLAHHPNKVLDPSSYLHHPGQLLLILA